jgi:YHS domain-containing protein
MTRTIVVAAAVLALAALLIGCGQKEEQTRMESAVEQAVEETQMASAKVVDLICGMSIDAEAAVTAEHEGKTYHFCSAQCKEKFLEDPEKHAHCKEHEKLHGKKEGHDPKCKHHKEEGSHEGHGH